MKRIFSAFLLTTFIFSSVFTTSFAEDNHVHNWSDWEVGEYSDCQSQGYEYRYCYDCEVSEERKLPLLGHEWSAWETSRAATPYKAGNKFRYCEVCYKEQNKSIPKRKLTAKQKKAIKTVKTYLGAAKKYNVNKMNKCFKSKKSKHGYPTAKYYKKLFKKYNKKIKWKFVDATGKGNTVKVKVKVTRPDFYSQFYKAFYKTCTWYLSHQKVSNKALGNYFDKKAKQYTKKCKKTTYTETVTFTVVKTKKGWKIKNKSMAIVDIACGYMNEAVEDASNSFVEDYS